ncbi:MAG TPA: SprT family zinc-dependent metalloprotease [Gammaproteobacteria bacterium]|nr:SprT family zinc-dependent metalloprotease [Gammaproteobacteria bacterium]
MPYLKIFDQFVPFQLRRSARSTRLRLEWNGGDAKVIAPTKVDNQQILHFLFHHKPWLEKQIRKRRYKSAELHAMHWPSFYASGTELPYVGVRVRLHICYSEKVRVQRLKRQLFIYSPKIDQSTIKIIVKQWFYKQALMHANHWLRYYRNRLQRAPRSLTIKKTKTLWGSCGIHGDIYLNWQLVCMPLEIFHYVFLHEMCHLFYRGHGKKFWGMVRKWMPDYKEKEKRLRHYAPLENF